jgi:hypothetical protein
MRTYRTYSTEDSFGADNKTCVFKTIVCDDDDVSTIDYCLPYPVAELTLGPANCQHYKVPEVPEADKDGVVLDDPFFEQDYFETAYFFEDKPDLEDIDITRIVEWLKSEVTQDRTPFCWKQTRSRETFFVTDCPPNTEKIGLLCYPLCKSGYSRQGTLDCQQNCLPGWRDDGLFCRLAEYTRPGYPWQFGDAANDNGMIRRCESASGGAGKCEKSGLVFYPKCQSGFGGTAFICRPPVPNCVVLGYNPVGQFDLSCPVFIELGKPQALQCKPGLEPQGLFFCYPPCPTGFDGVLNACWQQCDTNDQVECGAGKFASGDRGQEMRAAMYEQLTYPSA